MNKKVSIIVPVYNTSEEYLDMCIKSLLEQTYVNIEIIIVNDGSHICLREHLTSFENKDNRIRVIHKENGGVSSARNVGIQNSSGYFVAFVDSDDWVEKTYIESLISGFAEHEIDMSVCGYVYEPDELCVQSAYASEEECMFSKKDFLAQMLYDKKVGGFSVNKLFVKDKIKQLFNENVHYCEDFLFVTNYMFEVNNIYVNLKPQYHYRLGSSLGIINIKLTDRMITLLDSYSQICDLYTILAPECCIHIKKNILKIALNYRCRYFICHIKNENWRKKIYDVMHRYFVLIIWSKSIKFSDKINIILTYFFPKIVFLVKKKIGAF